MDKIDFVYCPMLKQPIDVAYCIELQMIADKEIKPTKSEENLTAENYSICCRCKKRDCPTPDIV